MCLPTVASSVRPEPLQCPTAPRKGAPTYRLAAARHDPLTTTAPGSTCCSPGSGRHEQAAVQRRPRTACQPRRPDSQALEVLAREVDRRGGALPWR